MVESTPLLRERTGNRTEGSNPSRSAIQSSPMFGADPLENLHPRVAKGGMRTPSSTARGFECGRSASDLFKPSAIAATWHGGVSLNPSRADPLENLHPQSGKGRDENPNECNERVRMRQER